MKRALWVCLSVLILWGMAAAQSTTRLSKADFMKLNFKSVSATAAESQASRAVYLSEDFSSNTMPPTGWTLENADAFWRTNNGNLSGGTAPEGLFYWTSGNNVTFNGTTRLISPQVDLSGVSTVELKFAHYLGHWSGPYTVGVATRSGSGSWTTVWSIVNPTGDQGPEINEILLTSSNCPDLNNSQFQFCFFFTGNTNNIYYWTIDDISIVTPAAHDVRAKGFVLNDQYASGTAVTPQMTIISRGTATETFNVVCKITKNGQELYSDTQPVADFAPWAEQSVNFTQFTVDQADEAYQVVFYTELATDEIKSNDTLYAGFDSNTGPRTVLWEEFTNTSCGPCANANPTIEQVLSGYSADQVVSIWTHVWWPSASDPFYTATNMGDVRWRTSTYYGINGVPHGVVGGQVHPNLGSASTITAGITQRQNKGSGVVLTATTEAINGHTTRVNISMQATGGIIYPDEVRLRVAVTEDGLQFSAPNGETHFNYVLRNYFPNVQGIPVHLTKGETKQETVTIDLDPSWVKSNLKVIVFLQNDRTKDVLQATSAAVPLAISDEATVTSQYYLGQNYPNPFNPSTDITFNITKPGMVDLSVYNVLGEKIKTLIHGYLPQGKKTVTWNGNNITGQRVASGVYFYRLETTQGVLQKKMILLK